MQVTLVGQTPDAERVVAAAARLCYADAPPEDLLTAMSLEEVRAFLMELTRRRHFSPFEHAVFTFAINGVSRSLTHELVRHRIASYSQRSQRYVKESGFEFITPPKIAANQEAARIYAESMALLQRGYAQLLTLGIPREDARFLLPNACASRLMFTMNARSLRNFFALRCCNRAQWEIRELAHCIRDLVRKEAPGLFSQAGPSCETEGVCHEGKNSCGRWKNIGPVKVERT